jgi:hypothetical protein
VHKGNPDFKKDKEKGGKKKRSKGLMVEPLSY